MGQVHAATLLVLKIGWGLVLPQFGLTGEKKLMEGKRVGRILSQIAFPARVPSALPAPYAAKKVTQEEIAFAWLRR